MIGRIRESETALANLARQDGLTKLLNRRAFDEAVRQLIARMDRSGGSAALLVLDIDHFKRINDTHGHGIGDDVLRAVARAMSSDTRLADSVFRTGGEEFAVLLDDADNAAAEQAADRLRRAIGAIRVPADGQQLAVTVSVGIAVTSHAPDASDWIETADAALYQAKRDGRNRVVVRYHERGSSPSAAASATASSAAGV